jgi:hypothetical protein
LRCTGGGNRKRVWECHGYERWVAAMQDYEFEVMIVAVVRVRAENEDRAREVVASSALGSPSAEEIKLANQAEFLSGKQATIVAVDFSEPAKGSVRLIAVERGQ